jgi:hypothetical protein
MVCKLNFAFAASEKEIVDNIKYYIQSETQYIPHRIFFQNALLNNIQIFSRSGVNDISIKKYETFQDRNINRLKLSKKLLH